ncbi:MAG: polysaccharide biosynthesis tyrosine autokinase [Candidatus Omnitrophota bacterium]
MSEQYNPFLEKEIDLRRYFSILYEKRWFILTFTVILCTLSLIRSFMVKPVYESSTRIHIQNEAPRVVNMQEVSAEAFTGKEYYQTQYKILKSRTLGERVNKEIGGYKPWNEWSGREGKKKEELLTDSDRVGSLLKKVFIKPIPNTQIVEIAVEDIDPKMAARIANIWAQNYISYVLDTKFDATQYASKWLQEKIKEAKDRVEIAEADLQEYRRKNKIMDTDNRAGSTVLEELLKRKAELEILLSERLEYYKDKHPEIIGIRSELASVENKVENEKEKELKSKDVGIEYNMLKREVDTSRKIYDSLLNRIRETEVTGELKSTNIRIIDTAQVPKKPVRPSKKMSLVIALFFGFAGSSALAFLFASLDQSIKTPDDIKDYIKMPALASIAFPQELDDKNIKPEMLTFYKPRSTVSEAYRSLRTSIMFTAVEHRRKTLLFTSSGPQEGKTTSAINLAIVMAQTGEKTVLVDADLRQPRIEKVFDLGTKRGLTEVLAGNNKLGDVTNKTEIENLDVIACGSIPPNPSELLGSQRMNDLLRQLEDKYDRIIIDTPPVLAVTDAVVLSGKVDGTIVVIKAGETNRNAVSKTKEILESVKSANLIGAVLNMVEVANAGGYYYYYHYYGKYGKYGHKQVKDKRKKRQKQEA